MIILLSSPPDSIRDSMDATPCFHPDVCTIRLDISDANSGSIIIIVSLYSTQTITAITQEQNIVLRSHPNHITKTCWSHDPHNPSFSHDRSHCRTNMSRRGTHQNRVIHPMSFSVSPLPIPQRLSSTITTSVALCT